MPKTEKPKAGTKQAKKRKKTSPKKKTLAKKSKPKTASRAKRYSYIHPVTQKEISLTELQYNFVMEYLSSMGQNRADCVVNAGYDVFYRDKKGNKTNNVNYNLARSIASENLTKPNITAYITLKMADFGWNDENVELQHLGLINQFDHIPTKQRAIADWYKLKGKYPSEKVEHSGQIEFVEVTNYGTPDEKQED